MLFYQRNITLLHSGFVDAGRSMLIGGAFVGSARTEFVNRMVREAKRFHFALSRSSSHTAINAASAGSYNCEAF